MWKCALFYILEQNSDACKPKYKFGEVQNSEIGKVEIKCKATEYCYEYGRNSDCKRTPSPCIPNQKCQKRRYNSTVDFYCRVPCRIQQITLKSKAKNVVIICFGTDILPDTFRVLFKIFNIKSSFHLHQKDFSKKKSSLILIIPHCFAHRKPLKFRPCEP